MSDQGNVGPRRTPLMTLRQVLRVRTPMELAQRHRKAMDEAGTKAHARSEDLVAYVNHGRWLADCPLCNSGIALDAELPAALCFDCGAVFARVMWPTPEDKAAIEAALERRPRRAVQNWRPGEAVLSLLAENLEHMGEL